MKARWHIPQHPLFILSLLILATNDFVLKDAFPGMLTGKLSDFAGMFLFTAFGLLFFSGHKYHVAVLASLWFLFWKSPLSQPLIDTFNTYSFYAINRVVDYSDLSALVSVPAALYVFRREKMNPAPLHPIRRFGMPLLCFFLFCSTSKFDRTAYSYGLTEQRTNVWRSDRSTKHLDETFRSISPQVTRDTAKNEWTLNNIYINDSLTLNTRIRMQGTYKETYLRIMETGVAGPKKTKAKRKDLNGALFVKMYNALNLKSAY